MAELNDDQNDGTGAGDEGQTSNGGETPKYLTSEQYNQAATKREKKQEARMEARFAKLQEAMTASFGEALEERLAATVTPPGGADDASQGESSGDDSPKFKALEKRLLKAEREAEELKARNAAKDKAVRDGTLRTTVRDALAKHGIEGTLSKHALGYLVDAEKKVRFEDAESDALVFVDDDGDEVEFKAGIADWAKSDEAKVYQAPTGAGGSGLRRSGRVGKPPAAGSSGPESAEAFGQKLHEALRQ